LAALKASVNLPAPGVVPPRAKSFREFLVKCARVRGEDGVYRGFTFEGREALIEIVETFDRVLGISDFRFPIGDCGGEFKEGSGVGGRGFKVGDGKSKVQGPKFKVEKGTRVEGRGSREGTGSGTLPSLAGGTPGATLSDATVAICGGAQFGKSTLELNLGAYCTGLRWLNWGFYLPNRELVEGMVDTKFRPDVLDQMDWFARMTQLGKSVNTSGRCVNRKGAFSVTNGAQRSHGMVLGLNKIPTSFTFDVTTLDEVDDIKPAREKFVRGRMTSSRVRLLVKIGTQRVAGRGQHKAWKDGSQGVMMHRCPACQYDQNLEENWPGICRVRDKVPNSKGTRVGGRGSSEETGSGTLPSLAGETPGATGEGNRGRGRGGLLEGEKGEVRGESGKAVFTPALNMVLDPEPSSGPATARPPSPTPAGEGSGPGEVRPDPFLTHTGDFRHEVNGPTVAVHRPGQSYYFACVKCGHKLDRSRKGFHWRHRREDRLQARNWSFRVSQFGIPAIELSQIVGEWVRAVADPEAMATFLCDRKAMPESTAQRLTPEILERAREQSPVHSPQSTVTKGERGEDESNVQSLMSKVEEGARVGGRGSIFGGVDTGRRCWFFARSVVAADLKRVRHVEQIALGNLVERVTQLFYALGLRALFIDQAPATDEARTLALRLNGLEGLRDWPAVPRDKNGFVSFPGGLRWNGASQRWENLRCAVVAFTKRKLGAGIAHGFDVFEKGSQTMFVPLIEANRFETIDRVVREFLTPKENVSEVIFPERGEGRGSREGAGSGTPDATGELRGRGRGGSGLQKSNVQSLMSKVENETGSGTLPSLAGGTTGATGEFRGRGRSGEPYVRVEPAMRLPGKGHERQELQTLEEHLLAGSEREELPDGSLGDYVDGCENHFLLADAYSALAELEAGVREAQMCGPVHVFENTRRSRAILARRERRLEG
jgi:hypothetical protein